MKIPIENIYFLLCYAWDKLREKEQIKVSLDGTTGLLDLFARLMIHGTRLLLKRGIDRNYITETIEYSGVKGKLELGMTLKSRILTQQRTFCTVDEFSGNILINRIIVSTLFLLMAHKGLGSRQKADLRDLIRLWSGIQPLELSPAIFNRVSLHRNNRFYGFLLHVCHMIYKYSLPGDTPGDWEFMDFTRDKDAMSSLFEAFLFNFYRISFPGWKVTRDHIRWQMYALESGDEAFLPIMKTDITIRTGSRKLIIDAKYYPDASPTHYGKESLHSTHLYQIFSYLMNQREDDPQTQHATGVLLYPTTRQELNLHYQYDSHAIHIKTINLNMHWTHIEQRLREVVVEGLVQ